MDPYGVQPHLPIWVGGSSRRSLRRAVELGDGWVPFGRSPDDMRSMLDEHDLPEGFEVVLAPPGALDPAGDPHRTQAAIEELRDVGATRVGPRLYATSVTHYCEQLGALRQLVPDAAA